MGQEIEPSNAKEYKEPQKLEPIFIQRLREIIKKETVIYKNQEFFIHQIYKKDENFLIFLSKERNLMSQNICLKYTIEQAEKLAKDNNLI